MSPHKGSPHPVQRPFCARPARLTPFKTCYCRDLCCDAQYAQSNESIVYQCVWMDTNMYEITQIAVIQAQGCKKAPAAVLWGVLCNLSGTKRGQRKEVSERGGTMSRHWSFPHCAATRTLVSSNSPIASVGRVMPWRTPSAAGDTSASAI